MAQDFYLRQVRVSVVRASVLVDASNAVTADTNLTDYRGQLATLMSQPHVPGRGGLPWPESISRFWQHQLGHNYRNVRPPDLVAALVPLRTKQPLSLGDDYSEQHLEILRWPYAVTTCVAVALPEPPTPKMASEWVKIIDRTLATPLGVTQGQVRDGAPPTFAVDGASVDVLGQPVSFRNANPIVVISCLLADDSDPAAASDFLARLGQINLSDSQQVGVGEGAAASRGRVIGIARRQVGDRFDRKNACYHENVTTLLGSVEGMLAAQRGAVTESGRWFRTQAAMVLTHMYQGSPLPINTFETVYKSAITSLWMNRQKELFASINTNAARSSSPPLSPL